MYQKLLNKAKEHILDSYCLVLPGPPRNSIRLSALTNEKVHSEKYYTKYRCLGPRRNEDYFVLFHVDNNRSLE